MFRSPPNKRRSVQIFTDVGGPIADGVRTLGSIEGLPELRVVTVKNGIEVGNEVIG